MTDKRKPVTVTIQQTIRIRRISDGVASTATGAHARLANERVERILNRLRREAQVLNESNRNRREIANEGV